jgi:nicotinamidase/pyrazinamidase
MNNALIIVDFQMDFVNGTLAVPGAEDIVPVIERLARGGDWTYVMLTADWHPSATKHFEKWPVHCVADTLGAQIDTRIAALTWDHLFLKGTGGDDDGYSGFEGLDEDETNLDDTLALAGVRDVTVVGLALDYCVKATALDAARLGYKVTVPLAATRAVNRNDGDEDRAIAELRAAGVEVTQ